MGKRITALVLMALGLALLLWPHTYDATFGSSSSGTYQTDTVSIDCGSGLVQDDSPLAQTTECDDVLLPPRIGGWTVGGFGLLLLFAPVRPARRAGVPGLTPPAA